MPNAITTQLLYSAATDLAAMIKRKEISAVELLEAYFARVDEFNPQINAVIWEMREEALAAAKRVDTTVQNVDEDLGPLHGVPMTIKESYNVAGTPTTWGNPAFQSTMATTDALAVQRLKKAGAILYGKTNVPLWLSDFQSYNQHYGQTGNPWDLERTPGGSSGGSAASLAAGFSALESGSDIGGSIRNPAHYCGVFGHKPTWCLLPPRGHSTAGSLAPSDLSVIGPLARYARDLEVAVNVMAGPDEIQSRGLKVSLPKLTKRPSELKIVIWKNEDIAPVDKETQQKVDQVAATFEEMGSVVDFEARPDFSAEQGHHIYRCLLNATTFCRVPVRDYNDVIQELRETRAEVDSPRWQLKYALVTRFRDWLGHNEERTKMRWAWHDFFQSYDVVIAPIMATSAFLHDHKPFPERTIPVDGEQQPYFDQVFWPGLAVCSYLPSTVIPTGIGETSKLPIGLQIIGPEYGDLITIGVAKLLEEQGYCFVPPPGFS